MLVDADHRDAVEPGWVIDQCPLALGEDRGVRRVPGHPQARGYTRDREMVDHDALQRPPHPATRQLRSRGRRRGEVFPPGTPAAGTLVSADPDQQRRRAVSERLVREQPRISPARKPLAATTPTPRIRLRNPALDHRPVRLKTLPHRDETELVQSAEHGQIRGRKGSVEHVEVFRQMVSVRTSIIGRPRPSPPQRRAQPPTPSTAKSQLLLDCWIANFYNKY